MHLNLVVTHHLDGRWGHLYTIDLWHQIRWLLATSLSWKRKSVENVFGYWENEREREREREKMGKLMPRWVGEKENGVPLICFYYPFCYLLDDNNEVAKKKIISYYKHLSFQPITSKPFKKYDHIKNFEKIISLYDLKIKLETRYILVTCKL